MSKTTEKKKIILKTIKVDELNTIWHPESTLVFKSRKDRLVIGRYEDQELIRDNQVKELVDEWNFKIDEELLRELDEEYGEGEEEQEDEEEQEEEREQEETGEEPEDNEVEEQEETGEEPECNEDRDNLENIEYKVLFNSFIKNTQDFIQDYEQKYSEHKKLCKDYEQKCRDYEELNTKYEELKNKLMNLLQ